MKRWQLGNYLNEEGSTLHCYFHFFYRIKFCGVHEIDFQTDRE